MDIEFQIFATHSYLTAANAAMEELGMPFVDAKLMRLDACPTAVPPGSPMVVVCQTSVTFLDTPLPALKVLPRRVTQVYTSPRMIAVQNALRQSTVETFRADTPEGMAQMLTSLLPRVYDQLQLSCTQEALAMLVQLTKPCVWPLSFLDIHAAHMHELIEFTHAKIQTLQTARNSAATANAALRRILASAPQS